MQPNELKSNCDRIAAIIGGAAKVSVWLSSESHGTPVVMVYTYSGASAQLFQAPTWGGMFAQAERFARQFVADRDARSRAGDAEYESWLEPPLPLAVAAE